MKLATRPATKADIMAMYPEHSSSFRAWVVELEGSPKGVIGIALYRPAACLFSAFDEELRPHLRRPAVLRLIKQVGMIVKKSRLPVMAIADESEPTSPKILKRLGFEYIAEVDGDAVYQYGGA